MNIENILNITVNDFQLCDIIHGRRQAFLVKLSSHNAPQLVSCDVNGQPVIDNGKVLPVIYNKIRFESSHITLKGDYCTVKISSIKPLYHVENGVTTDNPLYGHIVCYYLGELIEASTNVDYEMK